jgi:hypothetical protein
MVDQDIVDTSSETYRNEQRLIIIEDRLMRLETTITAILQGMGEAEEQIKKLTREVEKNDNKNYGTVGRESG